MDDRFFKAWTKKRILHIDMDAFFASVEVKLNPRLKGKPVIVGGRKGGRGVVAAASYEAREAGVRSGMPLVKAEKLCEGGVYLPVNRRAYLEYSERFHEIVRSYTPCIQGGSIDEAYLDLTHCRLMYPSLPKAAALIKERIERRLGLPASAGLGPSAAVAKMATEHAKQGGLVCVEPDELEGFLRKTPIRWLPGCGPKCQSELAALGVKTVGEIANVPFQQLKRVFKRHGATTLYYIARGVSFGRLRVGAPQKSVSRETTFYYDTGDEDGLLSHLSWLCDRCANGLRKEGLEAWRLSVKQRHRDFTEERRGELLGEGVYDAASVFRVAKRLLLALREQNPRPLRLIGVKADRLRARVGNELFRSEGREKRERLQDAVDEIRELFGRGAVLPGWQAGRTKLPTLYGEENPAPGWVEW